MSSSNDKPNNPTDSFQLERLKTFFIFIPVFSMPTFRKLRTNRANIGENNRDEPCKEMYKKLLHCVCILTITKQIVLYFRSNCLNV